MTHSPLSTGISLTTESSSRNGRRVDRIIIHHGATTSLNAILSLFQPGGRTVSANYAIKDRQLICTVDEDRRAWTSASADWDGRAITAEIANSIAGGAWPVSDETFDTVARWIADVAGRYGIDINDDTIITHQELYLRYGASYATACPGDLQRRKGELLNLARHYRGQGPASLPGGTPARPVGRVIVNRSIREIQQLVGADQDGIYGPDTTEKVIAWQGANRLEADGIWGPLSDAKAFGKAPTGAVPAPAFPLPAGWYFGPKSGPRESVSGYFSYRDQLTLWQNRMIARGWTFRSGADGLYGPETRENAIAFQKEKGLTVDGLIGAQTWKAAWEAPVT